MLVPESASLWLESPDDLLMDYDEMVPELRAWPVSRKVNSPANDGPELIDAAGDTLKA